MNAHQPKDEKFETLLEFLRNSRGFDFTGYKRASLSRRINRRMQMVNVSDYSTYMDFLTVRPDEFTQLFNTILINVTSFFRDPPVWKHLAEHIVPRILEKHKDNSNIRVWSAGCASGEETYTVVMMLAEAIGVENFTARVKVYATDVDEEALAKARSAVYTAAEVECIPPELRKKYFEPHEGGFIFHKELRRSIIFGRHDVIHDAPISRIDLLICRNMLMYLNTDTQTQVLSRLHFAIKDGGFLVLGKAEMILAFSTMFTPIELKTRIFQSASRSSFRDRLHMMSSSGSEENTSLFANQYQLFEIAFHTTQIPLIVVDREGMLALANERARAQFDITNQDVARPFQDLPLSYRPVELRTSIENIFRGQAEIKLNSMPWMTNAGENRFLDIVLSPLRSNGSGIIAVLISFTDITFQIHLQEQLERVNMDLEMAMGELQSSNEELETTNEELQSTIEELETTNEELQSSNEELETMNEELQSTNEEMEVLGEQSRLRSDELARVNKLLEAIVTCLRGGIIVTDRDMRVLAWNHKSEDLWGVRSDEALGESLLDLDIGLPVSELEPVLQAIIVGKKDYHAVTLAATNRRGKAIRCNMSMFPLVLTDGGIEGSILIVEDDHL